MAVSKGISLPGIGQLSAGLTPDQTTEVAQTSAPVGIWGGMDVSDVGPSDSVLPVKTAVKAPREVARQASVLPVRDSYDFLENTWGPGGIIIPPVKKRVV